MYHSNNLDILRGINSNSIDLIATDPPFNKNKDFHATPDSLAKGAKFEDRWSWDRDVHQEWVDAIKDDWPAVWSVIESARNAAGEDMAAFLCWLGVRFLECRRVLKETGSFYLHIDHTAHAWTKCLLDAIFGRRNFRNEIIWAYTGPGSPGARQFNRKHDTLLWYVKGDKWTFNADAVRIPHKSLNTNRVGRVIADAMTEELRDTYLERGKVPETWWPDCSPVGRLKNERTGYPTQKPLPLYERIIKASSNPGDMVLDPFCGCATTPVAAERLGRQWIGIDIWEGAYKLVLQRLNDSRQLLKEIPPEVVLRTTPPERTDYDDSPVVPDLKLRVQRPPEPWEKLSREEMSRILAKAQGNKDGVICAGCGRVLEVEFMELDHITPKSDRGANHILNRILLCRPCNGRKRNYFTLAGLIRENKRDSVKWIKSEALAQLARSKAEEQANWVRDNFGNQQYKELMATL